MILAAFTKSLAQLSDPRFRRVLGMGIGLTLALLFGAYAGLLWLVEWMTGDTTTLPLVGEVTWVGDLLSFGSLIFMVVLSAFLMVPVASAITSLFLDEVAQAVEDRHYSHLPAAAPVPFADALRDTLNFLGVLVAANILAIILYVMLPFAALFIFWGMNGFLLGREYFTLAAMRRIGRDGARAMRKKHLGTIWIAGVLMAMPLSIPLVNLLIPILGAATFTHIYHALSRR
ncbi:EI24 domain-containing protein [Marinovum sp. 2_MG-2023]|uniref:EI24 domain-containing protein n=1 Tax=Roseobacteraceae TaxID=2854170 RepID=UPI001FD52270|nr:MULTISPECIES: EI24 domain-containing protein [Roseobacteraceae]MCJ7875016.1 EI24 domain-containing protein [Phaeobacter sp. J2-8]MDO6730564.1 EI24 domain-containing protein [Marinovum sp. 2_MG-2023]MDO6778714.1 EI24 domain-containing protein [Marinovum sp. 1_MG-2023]